MSTTQNTKMIPADQLTVGTRFIPAGKKHPVEILTIDDRHPGIIQIGCYGRGFTVQMVSRYSEVVAVIPERAAA